MVNIPDPIFKNRLSGIAWKRIYDREYGVQYSELAISILATKKDHFPNTSLDQIVIPGKGSNTTFYIDDISWTRLVEGLNKKYTSNAKGLEQYEKQFLNDGEDYVKFAKKISHTNLKKLTSEQLQDVFIEYKVKQNTYSVFAWSAFILNNYVADKAVSILESYIKKNGKEAEKDLIIEALFKPEKRAAILEFQYEVEKYNGKLNEKQFNNLYEKFKWLSCLDIHNTEWSKEEFKNHIKSFTKTDKKEVSFDKLLEDLKPNKEDLEYLKMAKSFVYIKDARDDYRREGVFYAGGLYKELANRMGISHEGTSYLLDQEIINFLNNKGSIDKEIIQQRKKGFVMYIDNHKKIACLSGDQISVALKLFNLIDKDEHIQEITGRIASKGLAKGTVVIVRGINDLDKVKNGDIMIAVTTHPDFVPAMRRASAIVTDEGGITSHAAIISREFGVPCIVGTKQGTQILKDGDLVEVDANSGIVKKLN